MEEPPTDPSGEQLRILRRLDAWLNAAEAADIATNRRRGLRSVLVWAILLGGLIALSDLLPSPLALLHPTGATADLAVRIVTTTLAAAGAAVLVTDYVESFTEILVQLLIPAWAVLMIVGWSLTGAEFPGPLAFANVVVGVFVVRLMFGYLEVVRDIAVRREHKYDAAIAMRNALAPPKLVPWRLRRVSIGQALYGLGERVPRFTSEGVATLIVVSWSAYLAVHAVPNRSAIAVAFGLALLPLLLSATILAIQTVRNFRAIPPGSPTTDGPG